jgi:transketolase
MPSYNFTNQQVEDLCAALSVASFEAQHTVLTGEAQGHWKRVAEAYTRDWDELFAAIGKQSPAQMRAFKAKRTRRIKQDIKRKERAAAA